MKFNKVNINKLFKTRRFSVLIIPDSSNKKTKSRSFSNWELIIFLLCFTIVVAYAGAIVVSLTPLKMFVPSEHTMFNKTEMKTINELNQRIIQLGNELIKLQNNNNRLKNALKLGDSTLFTKENTS